MASRHKALDIRVFGSVARGEDRSRSDVDLLVRFAPEASLFDQVELAQGIEDILGVHVDVVSEGGLRPGRDEIREQARPLWPTVSNAAPAIERRSPGGSNAEADVSSELDPRTGRS